MNMEFVSKLPIPQEIKGQYPLSEEAADIKIARDKEIKKVFSGEDDRMVLIIGPCSADREDAVMEYISRLRKVQDEEITEQKPQEEQAKEEQIKENTEDNE